MHSLKIILYSIQNNLVHEIKFHSMEFSICGFMEVYKKSGNLEYYGFSDNGCLTHMLDLTGIMLLAW